MPLWRITIQFLKISRLFGRHLPLLPTAVDAIVNFVKPKKQRALRRYLGMVNYYNRLIPHCAAKITPLNTLLTEAHPNPSAPLNVTCDASDFAIGGVLQQCVDNIWQPLSFFSKKLSPAKTRYSAFDLELLAVHNRYQIHER